MNLRFLSVPLAAAISIGFAQTVVAPVKPQDPTAPKAFVWVQVPKLKVGDHAPSLRAAVWIKGSPVIPGAGKVTVVSFWASWCGPSAQTFPTLAELAKKYKGKADFVGVDVMESDEDVESGAYVKKVGAYVRDLGLQMPYTVALDDDKRSIAKEWLDHANQSIPTAFVVDRTGRIAWIGHPLADLSEILPRVINGTFSTDRAAARQVIRYSVEGQVRELMIPVQTAMSAGNEKQAVDAIERAVAKNPDLEMALGPAKFQLLLHSQEPAAYAYAKKLADGIFKDNPTALNLLAWSIIEDDAGLKTPDLATALAIAKRASELCEHSDAYILDTYALALYRTGDQAKALELQIKAVALGEVRKGVDEKILSEMRARLERFRKAANP